MTYVIRTVRLRGVSPGLDGVKAQVRECEGDESCTDLLEVTWLNGAIVADGRLFVDRTSVVDCLPDISEDEQDTSNPYGMYTADVRWSDESTELVLAKYERAATVNITNRSTGKVFYSEVFYGKEAIEAGLEISRMSEVPGLEPADFVFAGKRIKRGA